MLAAGVLTVVAVFPWASKTLRRSLRQRWSVLLLKAVGVGWKVSGELMPGSMVVANHISWLDIFLINASFPAAFVAKAEVRQWPIIGWLAAHNDTVFLRRGSRGHAVVINQEIGALLASGQIVVVFPEGTTTDGTHLLHFHGALIQPALSNSRPVVPVAVSYWDQLGARTTAAAYVGEMSLGECISNIVAQDGMVARVEVMAPLGLDGEDRREVSREARIAISQGAGLPPPHN